VVSESAWHNCSLGPSLPGACFAHPTQLSAFRVSLVCHPWTTGFRGPVRDPPTRNDGAVVTATMGGRPTTPSFRLGLAPHLSLPPGWSAAIGAGRGNPEARDGKPAVKSVVKMDSLLVNCSISTTTRPNHGQISSGTREHSCLWIWG